MFVAQLRLLLLAPCQSVLMRIFPREGTLDEVVCLPSGPAANRSWKVNRFQSVNTKGRHLQGLVRAMIEQVSRLTVTVSGLSLD